MLKNLTQLYCLAMCLIAAITAMVQIALIIDSSLKVSMRETRDTNMTRFLSNENYQEYLLTYKFHGKQDQLDAMTPEMLTQKRLAERKSYIFEQKALDVNSIISHSVWLIVSAVAFTIHWRLNKKYTS